MKLNYVGIPAVFLIATVLFFFSCNIGQSAVEISHTDSTGKVNVEKPISEKATMLDTAKYTRLMEEIANNDTTGFWPVHSKSYPLPGAILPFNRIVAFYGNLYSKKMGILGEFPREEMIHKLREEVKNWQDADSSIPVIPALHYIAVTAQGDPGRDGKHRMRMPFGQIDTIIKWADEENMLVFLDIQVGHSSVKDEIEPLEEYLKLPQVHFGIDPEFSMTGGHQPGKKIGTFDASDINVAIEHLAAIVKKYNLPPKVLIVHRFTQGMVTNYKNIKIVPEVQVVMDMDGWGTKVLKRSTWLRYIYKEPVQFTGFKLFYKNDTKTGADQLYTPQELLKFTPKPIYIQYQ